MPFYIVTSDIRLLLRILTVNESVIYKTFPTDKRVFLFNLTISQIFKMASQ